MPVALCAGQHFIFPGWMQRSCESEKKRSYGPHRRAGEYGNRADASLIQSYLVGRSGTAIGHAAVQAELLAKPAVAFRLAVAHMIAGQACGM